MAEYITSKTNPYMQHVRKLRTDRAYRYEQRQYIADGLKLLTEALKWDVKICTVISCVDVQLPPMPAQIRHIIVPSSLMHDLSRMDTPQGVITVCQIPDRQPICLTKGCLILDGIQDPGNLGTILRTADAFDVQVILSDGCADPFGEKTVRATMGVPFRTKICQAPREEIISACRASDIPLIVTALTDRAKDLRELPLSAAAVVIGSEGRGASEEFLAAADAEAIIPMSARCESLNAAVASAIVMWQMKC